MGFIPPHPANSVHPNEWRLAIADLRVSRAGGFDAFSLRKDGKMEDGYFYKSMEQSIKHLIGERRKQPVELGRLLNTSYIIRIHSCAQLVFAGWGVQGFINIFRSLVFVQYFFLWKAAYPDGKFTSNKVTLVDDSTADPETYFCLGSFYLYTA